MNSWLKQLRDDLSRLEALRLLRALEPAEADGRLIHQRGQPLINLASNNYLALANHPRICQAAIEAIKAHGAGSGSSRLISGHHPLHDAVESRFARFKHAEAALICPTGYMANLAVLGALAARDTLVCVDKLNHASLIDAAAASGAKVRVFPHRQLARLQRLLVRHGPAASRRIIVTDSVFSMDGDCADLPDLCDLAEQHDAIVVVDEAHATGVLGRSGAGLCEQQGVADRVDIVVSTASKALGGFGGIISARNEVIQTVVNRARSFIYTTATPPAHAAALSAALDLLAAEPWRRDTLAKHAKRLRQVVKDCELDAGLIRPCDPAIPIVPLVTGEPRSALDLAKFLREQGFLAPAIRPPSVAPGSARVRISLRADLHEEDLDQLVAALKKWTQSR